MCRWRTCIGFSSASRLVAKTVFLADCLVNVSEHMSSYLKAHEFMKVEVEFI